MSTTTIVIERNCRDCGAEVVHEQERPSGDTSISRRLIALLEGQASGEIPVYCDDCIAAGERKRDDQETLFAQRDRFADRVATSGLPPIFTGADFDDRDSDRAEAVVALEAWAEGTLTARGVYLYGEVGRGKSYLAAAAARAKMRTRRLRWVNVGELMMDLRRSFRDPRFERAMKALETTAGIPPVLVLDDVDKITPRELEAQPLYVAVNAWIEAEAPLLVTANRDLDGMAAKLGDDFGPPIASRLAGYCLDLEVGGRDRRLEP